MGRFTRTLLTFFIACSSCLAQAVPATTAHALDGTMITFPKVNGQKPLLLMVGFSHSSSGVFKQWNQRILSSYMSDPRIDYYELADLQGVPSFVKSMILHGMRREIHGAEQSHFAPITAGEDEWKKAVQYSSTDNTYVILADASGHIVWQTHGAPDENKVSGLKQALADLLTPAKP